MIRAEDLSLPRPLTHPPALSGPGDILAHAFAAREQPFALATRRVHVTGSEIGGVEAVAADGWPLLLHLTSDAGACAAIVIAPSEARRELVGDRGSVLETLLAGDRAAGLVAEWRPLRGAETSLTIRWTVPVRGSLGAWADDDPEGWRADGPVLGVWRRIAPRASGYLLFHLTPEPTWSAVPEEGGLRVEARVVIPVGGHATLLATAGREPEDATGDLRILRAAEAVERAAERSAEAFRRERLSLTTGVGEVDDALPWAAARLHGAMRGPTVRRGSGPLEVGGTFPCDAASERAWTGLGALAAGDVAAARGAADGRIAHPLHALLLGRLVAWTGEAGLLHARSADALRVAAELDPLTLGAGERVAWRAALESLLDAAECTGDTAWAEPLRTRRDALRGPGPVPVGGVRLPVVGSPRPAAVDDAAAFVASLLGGPEAEAYEPGIGEPASALERGLRAWAAYARGRHQEGYRHLRAHLRAAFEHVPGAWRAGPDHPCWDHTAAAALAPAAVLFGMLGGHADAFYGRLRLAPRIPDHWTRLDVGPIRVGDAAVTLRYARDRGGHAFTLRQTEGRVPLMLIFEPEVPGNGELQVSVDGAPAEVGMEAAGERVRVRLQLPLDREREVRVGAVGAHSA